MLVELFGLWALVFVAGVALMLRSAPRAAEAAAGTATTSGRSLGETGVRYALRRLTTRAQGAVRVLPVDWLDRAVDVDGRPYRLD